MVQKTRHKEKRCLYQYSSLPLPGFLEYCNFQLIFSMVCDVFPFNLLCSLRWDEGYENVYTVKLICILLEVFKNGIYK
jgi:hypothetical protein